MTKSPNCLGMRNSLALALAGRLVYFKRMKSALVETKNLFSTPFWVFKMDDDFRSSLVNFFSTNFDFGNLPTEYGSGNLFTDRKDSAELKLLEAEAKRLVIENLGQKCFDLLISHRAWLCGSGSTYTMLPHNHANSAVSFVFYFQVKEGGDLMFHDPRVNANRGYQKEFQNIFNLKDIRWTPTSGDIIMFPGFLYHSVLPHCGTTPRIAVALDFYS